MVQQGPTTRVINNEAFSFDALGIFEQVNAFFQAVIDGSGVSGSGYLEASADDVHWQVITNSTIPITGADIYQWNVSNISSEFIRLTIVNSTTNDMTVIYRSYGKV